MWCTTSGIKVSKWPEAFLRLLVIGKCLALGLGDMGGWGGRGGGCIIILIRINLSVWFRTEPGVGRKTLETPRDFVI